MNSALESMIAKYNPKNNLERENAIKEIIQEIALAGLTLRKSKKKHGRIGLKQLRQWVI